MTQPTLSIIIVNWNTRDFLARCLESLERSNVPTFQPSNVETFVVDNASTDGSADMLQGRFPWALPLKPDRMGIFNDQDYE